MSAGRPTLRLILASANPDKAKEIVAVLEAALPVELVPRPAHVADVVEDADTLIGNARLKAQALVDATGVAAVADDTGLEVDALGGEPGVYSARYAGEGATYADNVEKLLRQLEARAAGGDARRARFRTVALAVIADEPRGSNGFGYDPVFVPAATEGGDGRTFAEMTAAEKDAVSHRGRAFRALAAELAAG